MRLLSPAGAHVLLEPVFATLHDRSDGRLQRADKPTGPWQTLTTVTNPCSVQSPVLTTFYRVARPQPVSLQRAGGVPLPHSDGFPLESLAPGRYELRVVVVDRKANATASRSLDFTVE